jgi:hypothetical protein
MHPLRVIDNQAKGLEIARMIKSDEVRQRDEAEQRHADELAYALERVRSMGRCDLAELLEAGRITSIDAFTRLYSRY